MVEQQMVIQKKENKKPPFKEHQYTILGINTFLKNLKKYELYVACAVGACVLIRTLPLPHFISALAFRVQSIAVNVLYIDAVFFTGLTVLGISEFSRVLLEKTRIYFQPLLPKHLPQWPFINTPCCEATEKGLIIPPEANDILKQGLPEPKVSWESLKEIPSCLDLYFRINNKRKLSFANEATYYPRMEKYVGHLLTFAKENPDQRDVIHFIFESTIGRCEAIMQDIENCYYLYCAKVNTTTLPAAITSIGWKIREELFCSLIQNWTAHEAGAIRKKVAAQIGIHCPLENDIDTLFRPEEALSCIKNVKAHYPIILVKTLYNDAKKPPYNNADPFVLGKPSIDLRLRLTDADQTLLSYALFNETSRLDCFSLEFEQECSSQIKLIQSEIGTVEGLQKWNAKLFDLVDWENENVFNLKNILTPDYTTKNVTEEASVQALRRYLFYPLFLKQLGEVDIINVLKKMGVFKEKPKDFTQSPKTD